MTYILLLFIAFFSAAILVGIFGFGIGTKARFHIIKNELVVARTLGITCICITVLWSILVVYGVNFLYAKITSIIMYVA